MQATALSEQCEDRTLFVFCLVSHLTWYTFLLSISRLVRLYFLLSEQVGTVRINSCQWLSPAVAGLAGAKLKLKRNLRPPQVVGTVQVVVPGDRGSTVCGGGEWRIVPWVPACLLISCVVQSSSNNTNDGGPHFRHIKFRNSPEFPTSRVGCIIDQF